MFTDRPGPVDHMVAGAKLAESHTLHSTMQPGGGGGVISNTMKHQIKTELIYIYLKLTLSFFYFCSHFLVDS